MSFIRPNDTLGKKTDKLSGIQNPTSGLKQRPCRAVTDMQLLHPSGIDICSSSAALLSCLLLHSSPAHHHSGFPLTRRKYLLLSPRCLLQRSWHSKPAAEVFLTAHPRVLPRPRPANDMEQPHCDRKKAEGKLRGKSACFWSDPRRSFSRGCSQVPLAPVIPVNCT